MPEHGTSLLTAGQNNQPQAGSFIGRNPLETMAPLPSHSVKDVRSVVVCVTVIHKTPRKGFGEPRLALHQRFIKS